MSRGVRDDIEKFRARELAALAAVRELASSWEAQGERDMAFSKTIRNEDISMTFLAEGATKVENARMIRAALEGTP